MTSSEAREFEAEVTKAVRAKYKSLSHFDNHKLMCLWADGALPLPEEQELALMWNLR